MSSVETQNFNLGQAKNVEQLLGATVGSALTPPGMSFTYLSPQALIELVEQQVRSLDDQIFAHMKAVDKGREAGQTLSEAMNAMKEAKVELENGKDYFGSKIEVGIEKAKPGGGTTLEVKFFPNTAEGLAQAKEFAAAGIKIVNFAVPAGAETIDATTKKLEQAAKKAAEAGYGNLAAELAQMAADIEAGNPPNKGQLEKLIGDVETTVKSLSSSAEISMIQLQDLVQQRSRSIMFASNVLSSINDAARKTIDNLR